MKGEHRRRRWARRALLAVFALVMLLTCAGIWYVSDFYHADGAALAARADADGDADGVEVRELSERLVAFVPDRPVAGLVFYPGAKVEATSYAPLLTKCAEQGMLCVLVCPRLNIALLDADAAEGVQEAFPDVDEWMIGGHSLGGVAACSYVAGHEGEYRDLVLLASYPAADLSDFDGECLLLVGTEDGVLNWESYEESAARLPARTREERIDGGNHANYGNYGAQAGDGDATISREEQQRQSVEAILSLVGD